MDWRAFCRVLAQNPDVAKQEEVLIAALDKACDAMLAGGILFFPAAGTFREICYEVTIGCNDVEGLEDAAVISRDADGCAVLLELHLTPDLDGVQAELEAPFVVFWNCGRECIAVEGEPVEPGAYLTMKTFSLGEAVLKQN